MDVIKTNRLNLRPFTREDFDLLYKLHANPEVAKTTIDGVQSKETVQKHLNSFIAHQEKYGYAQWAVFENESEKFIGRAGITTRSLNQEIGELPEVRFAFLPEFWGKGYASEVTKELIKFAFEDLKVKLLAAANGPLNQKSDRVLTKNGFKFIKNAKPEGYDNAEEIRLYLITDDEYFKKND